MEITSLPEKVSEETPDILEGKQRRKIPILGVIVGGVVLIGIVGVVLSQVLNLGQPGPEPESPQASPTSTVNFIPQVVMVMIDPVNKSNNLTLSMGGDADTELVSVGEAQEQAWRSGNGRVLPSSDGNTDEDWHMAFKVGDDFIYAGSPTSHVRIEIEYLDDGTDEFNIHYDAISGGPYGTGRFKETDFITKTDSGEFRTAVFTLSDAYFANRNGGNDFRISDNSDGAETIRSVTITLLDSTGEDY